MSDPMLISIKLQITIDIAVEIFASNDVEAYAYCYELFLTAKNIRNYYESVYELITAVDKQLRYMEFTPAFSKSV